MRRATICFKWSKSDLIAVGCDEDGFDGDADAREQMSIRGNVVGKSYTELRRDRAEQLREFAAKRSISNEREQR